MPKVKNFVKNIAPSWPAVEVRYIGGKSPTVLWLNQYQEPVGDSIDISGMDESQIEAQLAERGVTAQTAKPEYKPRPIEPTEHCVAWRQTAGCVATGSREPLQDASCGTLIQRGRSGFCECSDGGKVEFTCDHDVVSCEEQCRLKAAGGDRAEL
eukprot:TRINITY_DN5535_c1_g1_i1.p1 TRINITY_DN5535_c1_g1~~TRINITY_DN5535_c1_g1_i1.p1  ORF type:complete len:154 (+),score=58.78 TRINITY_DN5535_c1_g1_i1:168-629(+)